MFKYVKFDAETGKCSMVGTGTNEKFYQSIGMVYTDVEQSEVDGQWYLKDLCPHYTDEEKAEQEELEQAEIEQKENEQALNDLMGRMVTADLAGDEEWKSDLRAEYAELMAEDEPIEEPTTEGV